MHDKINPFINKIKEHKCVLEEISKKFIIGFLKINVKWHTNTLSLLASKRVNMLLENNNILLGLPARYEASLARIDDILKHRPKSFDNDLEIIL